MFEDLEATIETLRDSDSGWVNRRDAAENLGKVASQAVLALRAHTDDADVDIRDAAKRAAGEASAALQGVEAILPDGEGYSLEDLAKGLESPGKRTVEKRGKGYEVVVQVKEGRSQTVTIVPVSSKNRHDLIRVYTRCGTPTEKLHDWALKINMSLAQCALAITEENGEEMFVMVNCFLAKEVSPEELKSSVKEIAYYGDWVEGKLGEEDIF